MQPPRHNHQVGETHVIEKLVDLPVIDCSPSGKASKAKRPSRIFARAVRRIAAFAALIRKDTIQAKPARPTGRRRLCAAPAERLAKQARVSARDEHEPR